MTATAYPTTKSSGAFNRKEYGKEVRRLDLQTVDPTAQYIEQHPKSVLLGQITGIFQAITWLQERHWSLGSNLGPW